ncbi:MAG: 50S ribosomal protein L15 [Elusimicrobiota bacterium]|jgi:large subunit ribosomal protein L15
MTDHRDLGLHTLAPAKGARKRSKRIGMGLGSGHGKTATRGTKGQTSRSGDGKMIGFEGGQTPMIRRIPKRGFRNTSFQTRYQLVDVGDLARVFKNQSEVGLEALRVHGLVKGRMPVKVLGDGELKRALKVQAHAFSKSAEDKIKKAGGSVEKLVQ